MLAKPRIICPRCRQLGLTTDCADQLGVRETGTYQLEVTVKFEIEPEFGQDHLDPAEVAASLRERLLGDGDVAAALDKAVTVDDYQLKVQPVFYD